jgi:hypothetical protein
VFAYGVALSLVILILEIAYSKLQRRCREWGPAVRHSAWSHQNTRTLLQKKTATAELRQSCDSGLADMTENAPPDSSALTGGCRKALPKSTTLVKWVAGLRVGSTTSMCIVVVILERQTATVGMPLLSGLRTSLLHSSCLLATRYARYATALVATARSPKRLLKADHTVRYMFRHIMVIRRCKCTNGRCNTEQCSSLATDFFLSISFITLPIANINISTYTAYIKIYSLHCYMFGRSTAICMQQYLKHTQFVTQWRSSDNQLTNQPNPCSTALPDKPWGLQLVNKCHAFYGTRKLITAFTTARHLFLS